MVTLEDLTVVHSLLRERNAAVKEIAESSKWQVYLP